MKSLTTDKITIKRFKELIKNIPDDCVVFVNIPVHIDDLDYVLIEDPGVCMTVKLTSF